MIVQGSCRVLRVLQLGLCPRIASFVAFVSSEEPPYAGGPAGITVIRPTVRELADTPDSVGTTGAVSYE